MVLEMSMSDCFHTYFGKGQVHPLVLAFPSVLCPYFTLKCRKYWLTPLYQARFQVLRQTSVQSEFIFSVDESRTSADWETLRRQSVT